MQDQKIRTKADSGGVEIGGWLAGRHTYLWLGLDGRHIGTVGGQKLYRLAKAIIRHYEATK